MLKTIDIIGRPAKNAYLCAAKKTDVRRLMPAAPSKETVGASSPQPFLPRRTARALALPIAGYSEQVSTSPGIADGEPSTASGILFWVSTNLGITRKGILTTTLGI